MLDIGVHGTTAESFCLKSWDGELMMQTLTRLLLQNQGNIRVLTTAFLGLLRPQANVFWMMSMPQEPLTHA